MDQANASVKDKVRGRLATGDTVIDVVNMNIQTISIVVSPDRPTRQPS